jgi:hypothetical protein
VGFKGLTLPVFEQQHILTVFAKLHLLASFSAPMSGFMEIKWTSRSYRCQIENCIIVVCRVRSCCTVGQAAAPGQQDDSQQVRHRNLGPHTNSSVVD